MSYKSYVNATRQAMGTEFSVHKISETNPNEIGEARLATFGFVERGIAALMGDVLTIVDSSIVDKKQNKAMKDLIRKAVSERLGSAADWLQDQTVLQAIADEAVAEMSEEELSTLQPVTVDEVLGLEE